MQFSRVDSVGLDTPYCAPSWKVRQIYNIAVAAQNLAASQAVTIQEAEYTITKADSVIEIQRMRLINVLGQANACEQQLTAQEGITLNEKKKKRRRGWIIVGIIVAWIGTEVIEAKR